MGLSASAALQLAFVGLMALLLFVAAYRLPQKVVGTALILLIPFQAVETKYASTNVLLTYVLFAAMLMRERIVRLPMLPQILLVMFAYLISMSLTHRATYMMHGLYLFSLVSAFLVFWIAYDLTQRYETLRGIANLLIALNVLVAIYCIVQLIVGPGERPAFLGIHELAMMPVRKDYRLTGPFGGAGTISEYLVIMIFMIVHQMINTRRLAVRWALLGLLVTDLILLVTTGARGGYVVLVGAGILFLWMFRSILGPARTIRLALGGGLLVVAAGVFAVTFTDFDRLFQRLEDTQIEAGIPDTRAVVWPIAWEEIKTRPLFGQGPRLRFPDEENGATYKGHKFILYPHNLYLFLLVNIGVTGLIAVLIFLGTPLYRCWKLSSNGLADPYDASFARISVVIMAVFFMNQIKIEFLRFALVDYWHFIFALLGILVGFCDRESHTPTHKGTLIHSLR